MGKIYLNNGATRTAIAGLIAGKVRDAIDTENTIELTLYGTDALSVNGNTIIEFNGNYYDVVSVDTYMNGFTPVASITAENVIYRLNQSTYNIKATTGKYDTVANIMTWALGVSVPHFVVTPFTFGSTDIAGTFPITANAGLTRRALLNLIADIVGGEMVINGYVISVVAHRGTTTPVELLSTSNVKSLKASTNYRDNLTSYEIGLNQKSTLATGDDVHLVFSLLNIDVNTRIMAMEYNPYNPYEVTVEVGDYQPDIKDLLVTG